MPSEDTIPMITQLQACSRLYTTEYQIRTIVTHSDTTQFRGRGLLDGLRVGVPLSSRHIAIPIDATVKGYVDMADLTERNIRQEGNRLTVILPDPRVELTATKVDHKQTRQFVRFLGRNFTDAERSSFERQGRDSIIASLPQSGIMRTPAPAPRASSCPCSPRWATRRRTSRSPSARSLRATTCAT